MRQYSLIQLLSLLIVHFSIQSCSNEIEIFGSGDPIPVVYCLLNPTENNQYVRVGKSFSANSDPSLSQPTLDSLIWPVEAEIYMERWENNNPVETILFKKNDMVVKDSGFFPTQGLNVYEADFRPNPGDNYHLFVYFSDLDKIVSGKTQIMSIPQLLDPAKVPGRTVSFDTISPYTVRWKAGDYPGLYQGIFKMNYAESIGNDLEYKFSYFSTPIYYKPGSSDMYEEKVNGLNFLQSVSKQIEPIQGIQRELINFEFLFYSAGSDLALIVNVEENSNNSFTLIGNSSNISGGVGVFSSVTLQRLPNLTPSVITKHFLNTSIYTKDLGFINTGK